MMIVGPPLYAIMANICYTMGPFIDVTLLRDGARPKLFKLGLYFSIFLTAAPGIWAVVASSRFIRARSCLNYPAFCLSKNRSINFVSKCPTRNSSSRKIFSCSGIVV